MIQMEVIGDRIFKDRSKKVKTRPQKTEKTDAEVKYELQK